ncbi:hypothetical protein [Nitrososphaera viennensis]|uniref:Uncharacterized protein n=1 Tax=Nitrososphaera viennensis TaxID=1034015 RepID=A0A977IC77_9ARCH|nr:hypothetical protein [Nitrososphaera viennensis]UVS68097.1 hypothetical protein NWT39_09315 [Nitrososphaera viennensis]
MSLSGVVIVADSHMAMVLPDDISERISAFVAGKRAFPFIEKDELACVMYLYGRSAGVRQESEVAEATGLAQRTAGQMSVEIDGYLNSSAGKLDSEYIRSRYLNRELQLAVEKKNGAGRLAGDPAILSDCFAQHVAFYRQDYFFGLYGPLKEGELTADIRGALLGRMVMVCYNRKSEQELGSHPLIPVYVWFKERLQRQSSNI